MKTIIAGSRDFYLEVDELDSYILALPWTITEVVSGGCGGIDRSGENWASSKRLPKTIFPAHWDEHGRAAGPIRNQEMAEFADALIAFPGSGKGTRDMIDRMNRLMKPVWIVELSNG